MKSHMRLLSTSTTGAMAQAPMHSPSFSVNQPSGVVSLKSMPRRFLRWSAAASAPCSPQGRQVQIVSLCVPSGSRWYIV